MPRWKIWKLRDYGSGVSGPDTEPSPGLSGVEAVRSAEVEVVAAEAFDALLADLRGEVERLRDSAGIADLYSPVRAARFRLRADRLQALIDKHSPSSKPSTEEGAADAAAPDKEQP